MPTVRGLGDIPASEEAWRESAAALDARMAACAELPLQVLPGDLSEVVDPASGRRVLLSPKRAARPMTGSATDAYREGRTPPTLAFVAADAPHVPVVESETESLTAVRLLTVAGGGVAAGGSETGRGAPAAEGVRLSPYQVVEALGGITRLSREGVEVPVVFPAGRWWARTFFNLSPIVADYRSGANGFVVAVSPEHEEADLGLLGEDGGGGANPVLPDPVFHAVVTSWALLERWADFRGLVPVPFVNGGKSRASGQSLPAFHAQFYALPGRPLPPAYAALEPGAGRSECVLCGLAESRRLEVLREGSVGVWAHPAPEVEATLVVAALDHVPFISSLPDTADFARGVARAVRCYEPLLGRVPPYNVSVRCGHAARHLHAEIIPRAGVAVAAGFEKATGYSVSTRPPEVVAAALREAAAEPGAAAGSSAR